MDTVNLNLDWYMEPKLREIVPTGDDALDEALRIKANRQYQKQMREHDASVKNTINI